MLDSISTGRVNRSDRGQAAMVCASRVSGGSDECAMTSRVVIRVGRVVLHYNSRLAEEYIGSVRVKFVRARTEIEAK